MQMSVTRGTRFNKRKKAEKSEMLRVGQYV